MANTNPTVIAAHLDGSELTKSIDKLVDEIAVAHSLIAKSQEQISKSQEQTDRILTLLEIEKGTKTPEDIKKD